MRVRHVWERLDVNRIAGVALWLAFVVAALAIPIQFRDLALPIFPRLQLAFTPEIQTRAALGEVPYQVLIDANSLLPAQARVLVVTDGTDVRHREYTTVHRALYYLTPRAVWWLSPAPADGTWESRWWHSAPLTESAIAEYAQEKKVDVILLLANQELFPSNHTVAAWEGARLVQFQAHAADTTRPATPEFAPWDGTLRAFAALALFFFNGALVLQILARGGFSLGLVEWFALSWCLGVGLVTFILFGLLAVGLSLSQSLWVVGASAFAGAAILCYRLVRQGFPRVSFPLTPQTLLLLSILVFQVGYVALIAVGQPLTFWDSWVTWSMKARTLFIEGTLSPALVSDPSRAVTHLDYPLLVPLAQAGLFQLLGAPDDRFVGWLAVAFFVALVTLVYAAARTFDATQTRALLAAAVVGALAPIALLAAVNYADVPLAVYGLLTGTYLLVWIRRGSKSALAIALIGAACLAWTKREGFVLALSLSLATLTLWPRVSRARTGAFVCALASGLVAVSWTLWLAAQGTTNTDFLPLTLTSLMQNLYRVPTILFYFAQNLVSTHWTLIWISAFLLLLLRLVRRSDTAFDLYLVAAVLYLGAMSMTYLFSDYAPYTAHLASSGYRLIAHVTPLVVVWLALQRSQQTTPDVTTRVTINANQATQN